MIYYLIPEYIERLGDGCRIRKDSGEDIFNKTMKSMINEIFKERCVDLKSIKRKCTRLLGQKNLTPIYLSEEEILIPVKIRKPRVTRDGGYGYVNYLFIDRVEDRSIVLKDESKLFYIDSARSIIKRIKMARILEESFGDKDKIFKEFKLNSRQPATKEDISLLIREIVELREKLEDML